MNHQHLTGLSADQVLQSREQYGTNVLTPPKRESLWRLYLHKFHDPIIRVLLIAAVLSLGISFVHWEFAETIGIFCAIFLATGVGFWFERDASKKFDVLNQVNDDNQVQVIREGNVSEVLRKDVVVGDIVLLNTGEEIPADGLLLEAISLQVDESCLTGEPVIDKTVSPDDFDHEATYASNRVMRGTKVVDGHGIMQVQAVGDATEYGKVAQKATEMTGESTPLDLQLERLAKFISVIGFGLAALTFVSLFVKDIVLGKATYTWMELASLGVVVGGGLIAMAKVWVPIVYDARQLIGRPKPLPKSISHGSWLLWIALGAAFVVLMLGVGCLLGANPLADETWIELDVAARILQYFMVAVTLIVVAVPEGLPMSVTLSLALSMRRMLQNNNLVRKMHACETMGATTVICTDKTGTLTQNQMQVHQTRFFALDSDQQLAANTQLNQLIREGIAVNSTAYLDYSNPDKIKSLGNPTEAALLLWLHQQQFNYLDLRQDASVVEQLTFSTERKYMATIVNSPLLGCKVLYVKGAPEIVLGECAQVLWHQGQQVPVSAVADPIEQMLLQYQNQAMRTLAFAYEILTDDSPRFEHGRLANANLTYVGIVAISDPVRHDVPDAVASCLHAGINVKIVTGDTPGTAREIARQIGIWTDADTPRNMITGPEFAALTDQEALDQVNDLKIMCRARPTDKQRLVQLLQQKGQVVAVTGDGTNDAPALNYAQVGLSMGSGTSVAKEASDITLLDDSFRSIASAVMWGRSLYQNIQRFILFQLTINVAALVIVFLGSIFGSELPLTVTQMLWVNLIMDTFAAGALASLPPSLKVMNNNPRKNTDFIITPAMRFNILFVGLSFVAILLGLLFVFSQHGQISRYNLSMFFTIFVMLQFWNMFNAKAFLTHRSTFAHIRSSMGFVVVAFIILVGQVIIVEFGGNVFRTAPLSLAHWLMIIGGTSLVLWIGELVRWIAGRKQR